MTDLTISTIQTMTDDNRPVSARRRIVVWLMTLTSLAVITLVVITANVLLLGVSSRINSELSHEGDKFRVFANEPVPGTGKPHSDVQALLTSFIRTNLPEARETLFSVVDGKADRRSSTTPLARLDLNQEFVALAASTTSPQSGTIETTAGRAHYAVFPVEVAGDSKRGALVVIEFAQPAYSEVWATVRTLIYVAAGSLLAAGIGSWLVAGRVLEPIRAVRRTAELIGESDLGRRIEVTGNDDVAELATTFNHMLDRIEAAFVGQRRFIDDASHELRTPITVIRGHLEVMGADPDEQKETIALVLDELSRMNRIVDDLMVLARSERPDFVIPGSVDLTELVMETLAKARTLGERHWAIDQVAETSIRGDAQRLTQALMQLLSNAVAHTDPNDRISVGSRIDADKALVWVRDSGRGIAVEDQERVFDRFARGRSGTNGRGAGLGLAIVQSIAAAHGGEVGLVSELGVGSTFTISLPCSPSRAEEKALSQVSSPNPPKAVNA